MPYVIGVQFFPFCLMFVRFVALWHTIRINKTEFNYISRWVLFWLYLGCLLLTPMAFGIRMCANLGNKRDSIMTMTTASINYALIILPLDVWFTLIIAQYASQPKDGAEEKADEDDTNRV